MQTSSGRAVSICWKSPARRMKSLRPSDLFLSSKVYNGQILVLDGGQALMGLPRDVAFLDE